MTVLWKVGAGTAPAYKYDKTRKIAEVSVGPKQSEHIGMPLKGPCVQKTTYRWGRITFSDGRQIKLEPLTTISTVGGGPFSIDGWDRH
jgi:hypothetical protein